MTVRKEIMGPFIRSSKGLISLYILATMVMYLLQIIILPRLIMRFRIMRVAVLVFFILALGYAKNQIEAILPVRLFRMIREHLFTQTIEALTTASHSIRLGEFITIINYLPREIRYLSENTLHLMPAIMGYILITGYVFATMSKKAGMVLALGAIGVIVYLRTSPRVADLIGLSSKRAIDMLDNNTKIAQDIFLLDHLYMTNQDSSAVEEHISREATLQDSFQSSTQVGNLVVLTLSGWTVLIIFWAGFCIQAEDPHDINQYVLIMGFFFAILLTFFQRLCTFIMSMQAVGVYYDAFNNLRRHSRRTDTPKDANTANDTWDISLDKVSISHDDKPVVQDMTWKIPEGSKWVLEAPSGSGKTTLLRAIIRLIPISGGVITIGGVKWDELSIRTLRRNIRLVNQDTSLTDTSIYRNIVPSGSSPTKSDLAATLRKHGLLSILGGDNALDRECGNNGASLSKGQQKIIVIARALCAPKPHVFMFDEPLASLDQQTQDGIMNWITDATKDCTVIITTHITKHPGFQSFQKFKLITPKQQP